MAFFGLGAGYNSGGEGSSSDGDDGGEEQLVPQNGANDEHPAGQHRPGQAASPAHDSSDSDVSDSDSASVDSATLRRLQANARLRDLRKGEEEGDAESNALALPSALAAFEQVAAKPEFLDPEATRPIAAAAAHGLSAEALASAAAAAAAAHSGARAKQQPGEDYDISVLAPPGKGQQKGGDKRNAPAGAVIEAKAKRNKDEEGPEATQQYTAAQIAMMGGRVGPVKDPTATQQPEGGGAAARGPSTAPMPVNDFLAKGVGKAQLPRKAQDRKDKEKSKREKGQSTHAHWKSEAEMVLRQQFDS